MDLPKYTVLYDIVSKENNKWVGTGWEFFDDEYEAQKCYDRHMQTGNSPCKREYFHPVDYNYLGSIQHTDERTKEYIRQNESRKIEATTCDFKEIKYLCPHCTSNMVDAAFPDKESAYARLQTAKKEDADKVMVGGSGVLLSVKICPKCGLFSLYKTW